MSVSRKTFTLWFGWGIPPFLLGAFILGFWHSPLFGIINTLIFSAWIFNTFRTTCRRCSFYGTPYCGLPGLMVPFLFKKQPGKSLSRKKIRWHYYLDLLIIGYVNVLYGVTVPLLLPVVLIGSIVGWYIVYQPRKYHGLLNRL